MLVRIVNKPLDGFLQIGRIVNDPFVFQQASGVDTVAGKLIGYGDAGQAGSCGCLYSG